MSGIPLWLHPKQMLDGSDVYIATNDRNDTYVGYIAFPLAEAEALIDPNDRDNEWIEAITTEIPWEVDGDGDPMSIVADAVQSLRMQRDERIDPNDPAVIERAERAVAYCIGRDFPSDRTAWTILAALRGKP